MKLRKRKRKRATRRMTTNRARSVTGGGTEARLQGTIGLLLSCHRTTGGSHATCGTGPAPKRSGRFKSPADWPCDVPELPGRDAPQPSDAENLYEAVHRCPKCET